MVDNTYANCDSVTSVGIFHYFLNGSVTGTNNLFTTDDSSSLTTHLSATHATIAQLSDPSSSVAGFLTAGDPWFWENGDLPRPWFEVMPEFLTYHD
jgi:hypothetical protein